MKVTREVNSQDSEAHGDDRTKINNEDQTADNILVYGVEDVPPWPTLFASALQHLFYCVGVIASYPVIIMPLLCYKDSQAGAEYRTVIAGTCLVSAGISTILQTTFGVRIPTSQGTSITHFVAIMSVLSMEEWSCPVESIYEGNTTSIHNYSASENVTSSKGNISSADGSLKYYLDNDGVIRTSDEVWMRRMRLIQGSVIIIGLIQTVIGVTGVIGYAIRFIGPLTIAPTLAMVTYALIDVIIRLSSVHWGLSSLTFVIFFITSVLMENVVTPLPSCSIRRKKIKVSITKSPIFALYPVLYSFLVGWIAYFIISKVNGSEDLQNTLDKLSSTQWFWVPYPFQFGWPIFSISGILGVMVSLFPVILENLGHFTGTALVCQLPPPPPRAVNRGIMVAGIDLCVYGAFGTGAGTAMWTTQSAVIAASKVASRRVFQWAGILLIAVGVFTKSLGFFALLPEPVMGGVMLGSIGSIFSIAIASLKHVNMSSNRNMFVLGISIMTGIGLPKYFSAYPDVVNLGSKYAEDIVLTLLRSPMLIGGLTGFIFDNISPGTRKDRGLETFFVSNTVGENEESSTDFHAYEMPFKKKCRWIRKSRFCPKSCPL